MTRLPLHRPRAFLLALLGSLACLAGCAGYQQQVASTVNAAKAGAVDVALSELEQSHPERDKDLLYYLEKGELLRMQGDIAASRDAWLEADAQVRQWEEGLKGDNGKLLGNIGAYLINDSTRRYEGRDYEKVLLNLRLALDHLALGDWNAARVEIRKMHERQDLIAELRSKELDAAKRKAEERGLRTTSYRELNGYPVETLDAPEVRALKNAYESAVAHYLAGFVYEALGEPSLAAAGYRRAIEMRPDEALLEEGLRGLDSRAARHRGGVDTLILVESGNAPAISSRTVPLLLPVTGRDGRVYGASFAISWPVVAPQDVPLLPASLGVDGRNLALTPLTNVSAMARRALADEMPGIIVRSSLRALAKGALQRSIQDNSSGLLGSLLSVAAAVAATATEQADERTWRTLPGYYSVGRITLPPGSHWLTLNTPLGRVTREVQLSGSHALVTLRSSGNAVYLSQSPYQTPLYAPVPLPTAAARPAREGEPAPRQPVTKDKTAGKVADKATNKAAKKANNP